MNVVEQSGVFLQNQDDERSISQANNKHGCRLSCTLEVAALLTTLFAPSALLAEEPLKPGELYQYPIAQEAHGFKPHELPFVLPNDGLARAEFLSEPFYAIILKSAERCTILEAERRNIQKLFPGNKVFMNRFSCDDENGFEEYVTYGNTNPDSSFIAVFGGVIFDHAKILYDRMELGKKFPGSNIRKMQAILAYP